MAGWVLPALPSWGKNEPRPWIFLQLKACDSPRRDGAERGRRQDGSHGPSAVKSSGQQLRQRCLPILAQRWRCVAWSWRSAAYAADGVITPRHAEGHFHSGFHRFMTFQRYESNWHCRHRLCPRHTLKAPLWFLWNASAEDELFPTKRLQWINSKEMVNSEGNKS